MPDNTPKQHALAREWAAARIVLIGGFIVAIGVAGYFVYRQHQETLAEHGQSAQTAALPKKIDAKKLLQVEAAVCTEELIHAKNIGIVPEYGVLATPRLVRTDVSRRFICEASTHLAKYFIAADLRCNNLLDAACMSVYRVVLKDGTIVYARPE